ncbi:SPFH domain-containing protein [Caulobacter sp. S45]|uniref:SPFH domain-containing protein n=1 Tax=Caulobacter sp. S45 TaxID=1641861 RepID=UPI001576F2C2|nr:SPFH domain-containing protein [Caulobacter sp. S45]
MKPLRIAVPLVLAAIALVAAINAVYVVEQGRQAVLLRLGQPIAAVNAGAASTEAGLHLKWPFVDQVAVLDRGSLSLLTAPVELAGASPAAVQAEMRYRIRDPLGFYRALGDERLGARRLSERLEDGLERRLAGAALPQDQRPVLARAILADVEGQAATAHLGVDILDVRFADAPPSAATVEALSHRMRDAEARQVGEIKAQGEQHKRELSAQADRDAADIRGEGERQALVLRGDGDAQRAAILGDAYGKDPAFAAFFRRLEAYDQALNPDNTTLVLSSDTGFLSLLGHGPGGDAKPSR